MSAELRVIATAGHVDHGKSSLIVRLTGIDPDRWAEEKRRGLTIDLGYAWTQLPGGREVGFVDVPGHERFIRNMLAGVGPVRLVLFVVAADEGWKPQSEEHLQILDVLGVSGAVIALTKRDLVDDETLEIAHEEVRDRVAGTALDRAPVVAVSATTGAGIDDLREALAAMLAAARAPEDGRARLFVDRVFSITGAGTVVTGTLEGACLETDDEIELYPTGQIVRVRSLQTHKKKEDQACPVSRVALNVVGAERSALDRGDVVGVPGAWRPVTSFDAAVAPVRGLDEIPGRGAFKVYAGAAEADAKLRLAGGFARIRLSRPLVLEPGDRFVLREAGRRATVGGGTVLDVAPPRGFATARHLSFLARRRDVATRDGWAELLIEERGAVPIGEIALLTGSAARADEAGGWAVASAVRAAATDALHTFLTAYHRDHPLEEGASLGAARDVVAAALRGAAAPTGPADALLDATPGVVRTATTVRLDSHAVALDAHGPEVDRLLAAIGGGHEATPPTVKELVASGIPVDVIDAAARAGRVIKIAPDLVLHPAVVDRARALVRQHADDGLTVSVLREELGTSRKYAVPLVEWMDAQQITRRRGDLRFPRGP